MKKIFTIFFAVFVLSLTSLTGCGKVVDSIVENEVVKSKELVRGSCVGNTYSNEFAGLTFNKPDDWEFGSDEEIAALMGVGADVLSESGMKVSEKMLELTTIYDMAANNIKTNTSVMVMFENLSMQIGGSKIADTDYLDLIKNNLEGLEMGYVFENVRNETVGGESFKVLESTIEAYGILQYYYVRKIDKYMLAIIVTVTDGNINEIMSCFS